MDVKAKPITVYVDEQFLHAIDAWAKSKQCSRSLAIRMIVKEFLLRGDAGGQ